jgi:hypothetical protein
MMSRDRKESAPSSGWAILQSAFVICQQTVEKPSFTVSAGFFCEKRIRKVTELLEEEFGPHSEMAQNGVFQQPAKH